MAEHSHSRFWDSPGWSRISAHQQRSFTLWFTGLAGTGKTTLANLVCKALLARGYKAEIIDTRALAHWLKQELHIDEQVEEEASHTLGYDAFITYICTILARNGVIALTPAISPHRQARAYAREHLPGFTEIYLSCSPACRAERRRKKESLIANLAESLYEPPTEAELSIDTTFEPPERSALRILDYLEQHGYIAPLWEEAEMDEAEIALIKARLQALGYLD
ncbi:MAG TPA: adenylyl-sulfate kinase [Ktedonobacteraceae bacterium]|nr:adenylyl-sulfate kinase [Ktedonobacteraceae bacterium]